MMRADDARWPIVLGLLTAITISLLIWGGAYLIASALIGEWA